MRRAPAVLLALAVLGIGCTVRRAELQLSPGAWRQEVARRGVDPGSIDNPLIATDAMREVALRATGRGGEVERLSRLQAFLFDGASFSFDYDSEETLTARGAFERRRGNCVSFTLLFIALARSVGIPVHAALLTDAVRTERREGLYVVNNHIVAVHLGDGLSTVFDFSASRRLPYRAQIPLDDLAVTAVFLNNLGARDLLERREEAAREHLEAAIRLAPGFVPAYGNLGLLRRRAGDPGGALALYRRALAIDPRHPTILHNLAALYLSEGRTAEARAAVESAGGGSDAPYLLLVRGDFELHDGRVREARRTYREAARRAADVPDTHLAVARAEMRLGRIGAARRALLRVLRIEPDHSEARELLRRLGDG